jgi:formin-binding protein 1
MMFVRHNAANWQEPANVAFEPSPVWLDEGVLATDDTAKNFLRNVLTKSKGALYQMKKEEDSKRREVEGAKRVREKIQNGQDKRDEVEIVRTMFDLQTSLHDVERQKITAEVEISTITSVIGDVSIGARNHNFKSETFKIPTNCDHCGERIWGLSAKGFICRDCGFTCHSKCEMKIPADCPGEQTKEEKKKLKQERQEAAHAASSVNGAQDSVGEMPTISRSDTMNTLSSGYASGRRSVSGNSLAPSTPVTEEEPTVPTASKPKPATAGSRRRRMVAPPPSQYVGDAGGANGDSLAARTSSSEKKGRMLYSYQQNGDGEISVDEGREVVILDPDGKPFSLSLRHRKPVTNSPADGSGWMKVRSNHEEGIVPASYVEAIASTPLSARPPSTYSNNSSHSLAASTASASHSKKKGPAVAPKRGAKKLKYVEALYEYEARTDAEHSMHEGERFVLINRDAGDGWADVEKGGVVKAVPANYIQDA